ncbi:MAG: GGDEF domain-containing protein [Candidatus Zixiibacteriota bacterium]
MTEYLGIVIVLSITVVVAVALWMGVRQKHRLRRLAPQAETGRRLGEVWNEASTGGSVKMVARGVSDILKNDLGCEVIMYLRQRGQALVLDFSHGLPPADRPLIRLDLKPVLTSRFLQSHRPMPLGHYSDLLPAGALRVLERHGADTVIPITWRGNLYGVYFLSRSGDYESSVFDEFSASLAHSLSVAYHCKWFEEKVERLQRRRDSATKVAGRLTDETDIESRVLRLVRHRRSESLVPELIETVKKDIGVDRIAYLYAAKSESDGPIVCKNGLRGTVPSPTKEQFDAIVTEVGADGLLNVDQLASPNGQKTPFCSQLLASGLSHVAAFPLNDRRAGLLCFGDGNVESGLVGRMNMLRENARHLLQNVESFEKVEELSYTDSLTGLANRRYFRKRLDEEISRALRHNRNLALVIFDLDLLKVANDTFGHLAGDAILSQMGRILKDNIRAIDVTARYGGDEFCVVMPEAGQDMCQRFMARLQREVSGASFEIDGVNRPVPCTISLGGAVFPDDADEAEKLIFAADMALLQAKERGRNRFVLTSSLHDS